LYVVNGRPARALDLLQRAHEIGRPTASSLIHRGLAHLGTGDYEDALALAARADSAGTEPAAAAALRAQALEGLDRFDEAAAAWNTAVDAAPGRSFTWWLMTARALARTGNAAGAAAATDTARALATDDAMRDRTARLRAAIEAGCYTRPGRSASATGGCTDPLADWIIVTPAQGIALQKGTEAR
jgi:tetratricopeptide (TPR) repeat protein